MVVPKLDQLPVYVREGTILPIAPLVQSTEEKPAGPLTLRVFPGDHCEGTLYQDDGTSFAFRKGVYLREHFACTVAADGTVTVKIAKREGSFQPWWTSLCIEVVGAHATTSKFFSDGRQLSVAATPYGAAVTIAATGRSQTINLSNR